MKFLCTYFLTSSTGNYGVGRADVTRDSHIVDGNDVHEIERYIIAKAVSIDGFKAETLTIINIQPYPIMGVDSP